MGFFRNLIRSALNSEESKPAAVSEGNAVGKNQADLQTAVEAAEGNAPAVSLGGDFDLFPKWTYSSIEDTSKDAGDDYESIIVTAPLTDDTVAQYQSKLSANGFSGDTQLMSKAMSGKRFIVDFSFVPDSQIQYMIQK